MNEWIVLAIDRQVRDFDIFALVEVDKVAGGSPYIRDQESLTVHDVQGK